MGGWVGRTYGEADDAGVGDGEIPGAGVQADGGLEELEDGEVGDVCGVGGWVGGWEERWVGGWTVPEEEEEEEEEALAATGKAGVLRGACVQGGGWVGGLVRWGRWSCLIHVCLTSVCCRLLPSLLLQASPPGGGVAAGEGKRKALAVVLAATTATATVARRRVGGWCLLLTGMV